MRSVVFALAAAVLPCGVVVAQNLEDERVPVIGRGFDGFRTGPRAASADIRPGMEVPVEAFCTLLFDVSHDGRVEPESIVADCDDDQYVETATAMVASWIYDPLIVDGEARAQLGVTAEVRFREPG